MTVICPQMLKKCFGQQNLFWNKGMFYENRKSLLKVNHSKLTLKSVKQYFKDGDDVTLFVWCASCRSLECYKTIQTRINMSTIKPIDKELIISGAKKRVLLLLNITVLAVQQVHVQLNLLVLKMCLVVNR